MYRTRLTKSQVVGISVLLIVAWGVFVRLWGLADRAFWRDEAWVAELVERLSHRQLLRQAESPVPPLFAASAKLSSRLVSPAEVGLRLPSVLCGVAVLPLAYFATRAVRMPRTIALAGTALCASSFMLVNWSRELKQYELEAFFSVLLALLVFRFRRRTPTQRRIPGAIGIIVICLLGPWFGYGVVFSAATLVGILVVLAPVSGMRRSSVVVGVAGLASLALSTGFLWQVAAADQAANEALIAYMGNWFINPAHVRDWLRAGAYAAYATYALFFPDNWTTDVRWQAVVAIPIWAVAIIGLATWPRRGRLEVACWAVMPWLLLAGAALAQRYPFGVPRMMVFLAPPLVIAVAAGVVVISRQVSLLVTQGSGAGMVFGALLTLLPVLYMVNVPIGNRYWMHQDFPAVLRVLERERGPGEIVFVDVNAAPCVRYYVPNADESFYCVPTVAGTLPPPDYDYEQHLREIARKAGPRWWFLRTPEQSRHVAEAGRVIQAHGYRVELVAESGNDGPHGKAQLFAFTRRE